MAADPQSDRYARQIVLREVGPAGQARLAAARVVIVGLGGLGSHNAGLLARAGVGTLRLVDGDIVEWSNLQRQGLYEEEDAALALPKAEAAAWHLQRINATLRYEPVAQNLTPGNAERIIAGADVVVDGLDNFPARALLNEACVKLGIPWVHGACLGTSGSVATIIPGISACLNCWLPGAARAVPPLTCEEVGILAPLPALIAAWQSAEALKILLGHRELVSPCLTQFDPWQDDVSTLKLVRDGGCTVCGRRVFTLLAPGGEADA